MLAELADLIAKGELEVPITGVFALDDVRDAYRQLELCHTRGKFGLRPLSDAGVTGLLEWFDRLPLTKFPCAGVGS